jgi:aromatic-L-amino-acid/L-tryptophan decarboxylase
VIDRPNPFQELNWNPDRAHNFGERIVDLWTEWLEKLPSLPVDPGKRQTEVAREVGLEIPAEPMSDDELFAHMRSVLFDNSMYPGHPGFMAYISGSGTVPGAGADLLAAAVNQNVGGWRLSPAATEIELQLTRWFAGCFGLPEESGGLMVSGSAMANFVALKAARDIVGGLEQRVEGIQGRRPLKLYASREVHDVVPRAADMLGIGSSSVRLIEVDDDFRMRTDELEQAIKGDVDAGYQPLAVIATAGTVGTGSIDPLPEIALICERHGVWLHVDGAYGGPAVLSDDLRPLFAGIERADSIAFDPHKWLYTPHSGGCVLTRDFKNLEKAFNLHASYTFEDKERTGRGVDLMTFGPQFSRGFSAFKVWLSLLAHGHRAYSQRIAHDAALSRYLSARMKERPDFELMAPVVLSICCFRYVPEDLRNNGGANEYLDRLNERIMTAVQLDGRVFFSNAVLGDRFVLRTCIVNFRTEADHLDGLIDVTAELGRKLDKELRPDYLAKSS